MNFHLHMGIMTRQDRMFACTIMGEYHYEKRGKLKKKTVGNEYWRIVYLSQTTPLKASITDGHRDACFGAGRSAYRALEGSLDRAAV